jgi:hypothetical protein
MPPSACYSRIRRARVRRAEAGRGARVDVEPHPRAHDPRRTRSCPRRAADDQDRANPYGPPPRAARGRSARVAHRPGNARRRDHRLSRSRRHGLGRRRVALLATARLHAGGKGRRPGLARATVRPSPRVRVASPRRGGERGRDRAAGGPLADDDALDLRAPLRRGGRSRTGLRRRPDQTRATSRARGATYPIRTRRADCPATLGIRKPCKSWRADARIRTADPFITSTRKRLGASRHG